MAEKKIEHDKDVTNWLNRIEEARKREDNYRKEAQRCVAIYEASASMAEESKPAYNILYANTETLSPALYNSTPRPVVSRRFKDENLKATTSAKVLQRTLEFLVDANQADYSPFDDLQKSAVLEALVPGRGLARFKYEPTITSVPPAAEALQLDPKAPSTERKDYETVCGEEVSWNRVLFGYAMRWSQVPWIAYEHFMTEEEVKENFGDKAKDIALTATAEDSDKPNQQPVDAKGVKFAHIWEIWDKSSKKIIFLSDGAKSPIKTVDDPLKLSGFFNMPRPMTFLPKISSMIPQPLYLMYEHQARELDIVTKRITALTRAMKVRGFYDGTINGLDQLMKSEDNTLLPAQNVAALQQGQSLENSIWLMPLEKLITVLQQLYVNRQQVKSVIYEITGIADILRGSSQASETLGAQKMKEAWGTMRLKRMQKETQRFAKDSLRLMAEIAAKNFDPQTFAAMTGIKLPDAAAKQQAQQLMQMAQMAQQPPQPGMPPPPQIPPEALAQAKEVLALPTWDEVVAMLRDDLHRNYSIDIETNSTIDAEATEDKEQVAEFMNAFSQMLNGLGPLVEKGFMPFDVAKSLMLAVVKRFRFGTEVEEDLKKMVAPPPQQQSDPKAQAEAAKIQQETQQAQQLHQAALAQTQLDAQVAQATAQVAQQEAQAKMAQIQRDEQLAQAKFAAMMKKFQGDSVIANLKVETAVVQADATKQIAEIKVETAKNPPAPAPAGD